MMQSLALASIANIGGAEFAEALTPDVQVQPGLSMLVPLPTPDLHHPYKRAPRQRLCFTLRRRASRPWPLARRCHP